MNDDRVDQRGSIFIIVNLFLKQEGRKSFHESKRKETVRKKERKSKGRERKREKYRKETEKTDRKGKERNERPDFVLFLPPLIELRR